MFEISKGKISQKLYVPYLMICICNYLLTTHNVWFTRCNLIQIRCLLYFIWNYMFWPIRQKLLACTRYWLYEWRVSYERQELMTLVRPWFFGDSVLLMFLVFCVVFFGLIVFLLCLVYPMLPVYLDCPFLICHSVFSNVYWTVTSSLIGRLEIWTLTWPQMFRF